MSGAVFLRWSVHVEQTPAAVVQLATACACLSACVMARGGAVKDAFRDAHTHACICIIARYRRTSALLVDQISVIWRAPRASLASLVEYDRLVRLIVSCEGSAALPQRRETIVTSTLPLSGRDGASVGHE